MKRRESNFAKLVLALFISCALSSGAEEDFFRLGAPLPPGDPDYAAKQTALIAQLKQQAVDEYLQRTFRDRYPALKAEITPEFVEKYVRDYAVGRSTADPEQLEINGHLNVPALRNWVNLQSAKGQSESTRALVVFSSSLPSYQFRPHESSARQMEPFPTAFAETLETQLQRLRIRTEIATGGLSTNAPPRSEDELKALGRLGYPIVIWTHLSPCTQCGVRAEMIAIDTQHGKMAIARQDDLILDPKDYNSLEKIRIAVKTPLEGFSSDLEEFISSGILYQSPVSLKIEDADPTLAPRLVRELAAMSYGTALNSPSLAGVGSKTVSISAFTNLSLEQLGKSLEAARFNRFRLKFVRIDSPSVVVRYLKTE